jgi:hypothetical protein
MKDEKSVNVYLTESSDRQRVYGDDKPDPHKHFIIVQNESLTHKANLLTTENQRLQKDFDEKDDEVDKMEIQVRYMRGELKNFVELRNLADKITSATERKGTHMSKQYDKTSEFIPRFLTQFVLSKSLSFINCIALWYFDKLTIPHIFTTELVTIISTTAITGVSPRDISNHKKEFEKYTTSQHVLTNEIKKIREEVKRADSGNDFISKYIDSM